MSDNFTAVRQNSAAALANAARTFGKKGLDIALHQLDELLPMAKKQPAEPASEYEEESAHHHHLPKGAHIKHIANITDLIHSAESKAAPLASKIEKSGGEIDYASEKKPEPWESTDGAISLLKEMSQTFPKEVAKYLPMLAELTHLNHFHHASCIRETIYLELPTIMKNVGKPQCKANIEFFYDDIFSTIHSKRQNVADAAIDCLRGIGSLLGPSILKGRLASYRPEYAEEYESIIKSGLAVSK